MYLHTTRKVLSAIALGMVVLICLIWINEAFELHLFPLRIEQTPINAAEGVVETIIILGIFSTIYHKVSKILKRLKHLEGVLAICSSCKKIRGRDGQWHHLEDYISSESDAVFTHTLCEECAKTLYPDIDLDGHEV